MKPLFEKIRILCNWSSRKGFFIMFHFKRNRFERLFFSTYKIVVVSCDNSCKRDFNCMLMFFCRFPLNCVKGFIFSVAWRRTGINKICISITLLKPFVVQNTVKFIQRKLPRATWFPSNPDKFHASDSVLNSVLRFYPNLHSKMQQLQNIIENH